MRGIVEHLVELEDLDLAVATGVLVPLREQVPKHITGTKEAIASHKVHPLPTDPKGMGPAHLQVRVVAPSSVRREEEKSLTHQDSPSELNFRRATTFS
jgi:hypothetical protein